MLSLFDQSENRQPQYIDLPDGQLVLYSNFLSTQHASHLFDLFYNKLAWQQEYITLYGRRHPVPRLSAWYADPGLGYTYSGVFHPAQMWPSDLFELKLEIERALGLSFNSVLANLYRNGLDKVGWHADNEPELGQNPYIASLSLGASRRFDLRHNTLPHQRTQLPLHQGDLLLMGGALQHYWQHQVPQQRRVLQPRINLTFRRHVG